MWHLENMIRQAELSDANAIFILAKEFATSFVVEEKAFYASIAALLADSSVYLAVAEVDEGIVGYVLAFSHHTLYANGRVAWVEELMVDANSRKRGIGKAFMRSVEE
jgi:GNAT superfamily N-acetyltransferase